LVFQNGMIANPPAHPEMVCEIICPNDIVTSLNDSGLCDSTFVNVPLPIATADCSGGAPIFFLKQICSL